MGVDDEGLVREEAIEKGVVPGANGGGLELNVGEGKDGLKKGVLGDGVELVGREDTVGGLLGTLVVGGHLKDVEQELVPDGAQLSVWVGLSFGVGNEVVDVLADELRQLFELNVGLGEAKVVDWGRVVGVVLIEDGSHAGPGNAAGTSERGAGSSGLGGDGAGEDVGDECVKGLDGKDAGEVLSGRQTRDEGKTEEVMVENDVGEKVKSEGGGDGDEAGLVWVLRAIVRGGGVGEDEVVGVGTWSENEGVEHEDGGGGHGDDGAMSFEVGVAGLPEAQDLGEG